MKKFIASLVLLIALVSSAKATIGYLSNPNIRVWNSAGTSVLTGGYIVTCVPGTVCNCTAFTGKTTYTDSTGLIPNTNPVLLDPTGSASIWYDGTAKIVACNSFGAIQWTKDNVPSVALGTSSTSATTEWVALSNTPSFLAANQFSVLGDYTSTFPTGRRLKLTQAGGDVYATVVSSSLLLGVTTVTVVVDSTAINVTLTGISVSLLDPTHTSIPFQPVVTKTTSYTLSAIDCGKTIEYVSTSASATFTFPAATLVPSGCSIVSRNTSTFSLVEVVTFDGISNPALIQYEQTELVSNGTSWEGKKLGRYLIDGSSNTAITVRSVSSPSSIPVTGTDGRIRWTNKTAVRGAVVYNSSFQAISSGVSTSVGFNTELYDTDSIHTSPTNSARLVIPAGISYARFQGSVSIVSSLTGTGSRQLILKEGGATLIPSISSLTTGTGDGGVSIQTLAINSPVISVSPGGYFELYVFQDSGEVLNISNDAWFAVELIQ